VNTNWRRLWGATAISTVGDGAFLAALPLVAVTMTTDPRLIAGITAWGTLPWLLAALPAGALVDRGDARRAMVAMQCIQGVIVAGLAALSMLNAGGIWLLYLVAFAVGLAETVAKVAAQKLVPAVVAQQHLERANGRQNATLFTAHDLVGPPLGALLLSVSTPLPFWVDAVTFLLSALLVARIAVRRRVPASTVPVTPAATTPTPRTPAAGGSLWRDVTEGLRWLGRHRLLRTLSLLSGVANLANYLANATLVLFAAQRLGVHGFAFGLLIAGNAIGGVAGSLFAHRAVGRFGGRRVVAVTVITTPAAMLAIGLFAHDLVTMMALSSVCSGGAALWNVASGSLRQRTTPTALLGRVSSAGLLLAWGVQPIGAVLGGLTAGWFGPAAPWLIAGALRLAAAVVALPVLRDWPAPERAR
jgi:MFS family permease